ARHARGAGRRHRGPELLHRPRPDARRDPVPVAERRRADPLHPERRPADERRRPHGLPDDAAADGRDAARVRERAGREHRGRLVKKRALSVETPLVIDSTEADVIEAALEACPGVALVNSINLENGRARIEALMPHVMRHGAAVTALTIDEQGMAKTAARKLEV